MQYSIQNSLRFEEASEDAFPCWDPSTRNRASLSNFCPKKIVADGEGASAQNLIVCVLL